MRLINSPFEDFDWSVLDSREFQEDAVREEIIAPLLRALGYKVAGPNRIVRSKKLEHPFVALGTTQHRISLIPDYLMYANDRPAWILDAKAPKESVVNPRHEGQAYSYVCHRDVRADWYAVCNGREFAAFNVGDMSPEPRVRVPLDQLSDRWGEIWTALAPEVVHKASGAYLKDFGIHLHKMGLAADEHLDLRIGIPVLARVEDSVFTINGEVLIDGQHYFATFDFDRERLSQLVPLLPSRMAAQIEPCFRTIPSMIKVQDEGHGYPRVAVTVRLASEMQENKDEHYWPLEVLEFRAD